MGLHARHLVGRVLHGKEAREQLAAHKRDSHGSDIRLHVPDGYENKAVENAVSTAVDTAVSVVYVTLPQTFSGSASYVTMTSDSSTETPAAITSSSAEQMSATALQAPARASSSTSSVNADEASYAAAKSSANAIAATTSSAALFAATTATQALTTPATQEAAATVQGGTPLQASRTPSATAGAISETNHSSGMSGGAKAGVAFAVILAIALAAGLLFFCWRRKKSQKDHEQIIDEKHGSFADTSARSIEASHHNNRTSVMSEKVPASLRSTGSLSAPRLSLRPVTQFLPTLMGGAAATNNNNGTEKPKSAWERKPVNAQQNPFDDAPVLSEKQARPVSPPSNPFEEGDAAAAAVKSTSAKHSPQSSWEGSEPPTPKSTKFGTASTVSVAAAGTPNAVAPPRGPNNVHRVQLDFKPSMEDELELRSGQLVRMLHEYDDGWALCIRMDRSQQGVAPRTCLSKMPVKPRPQGPPPQGSRPGTAGSNHSGRGPSNGPAPNSAMVPRPLTPNQSGNVPSRKPVPGQAM